MKKTILITGSTSCIGLGIASAFAEKKYNITFIAIEKNGPGISKERTERHKMDYVFSNPNMLDRGALLNLVRQCMVHFGSIDLTPASFRLITHLPDRLSKFLNEYSNVCCLFSMHKAIKYTCGEY